MRYDDELGNGQNVYDPNPIRCIALSIALIYYFRLPTREDNVQRKDDRTPSREDFAELLDREIPDFDQVIQNELKSFVNTQNFVIPQGVAINQAVGCVYFSSQDWFELSLRFVNISSPLSLAWSLGHLCVLSVFLVSHFFRFEVERPSYSSLSRSIENTVVSNRSSKSSRITNLAESVLQTSSSHRSFLLSWLEIQPVRRHRIHLWTSDQTWTTIRTESNRHPLRTSSTKVNSL